jgi:hypothetical protein
MIGLLFLFVIGLWIVISITLGIKIPKWLGMKRDVQVLTLAPVFVLLIFVAPVADEIIAYPQMKALCKQVTYFELAPGMDEKSAFGRTVYYTQKTKKDSLWPPSVEILLWEMAYIDAVTKEPVLHSSAIEPLRGMLGVPNGSSGGQMTVILGNSICGSRVEAYDTKGVPTRFSHLKLTKVSNP